GDPADGNSGCRLGVDVGGTFTDLVLQAGSSGARALGKALTTPADPSVGVLEGVTALLRREGVSAGAVAQVIHATTLVGNAIIERKGPRTALVTTRGFRDVLTLGREFRYDIYEPNLTFPAPLVPRRDRIEATERIGRGHGGADCGEVIVPLEPVEV